MMGNTELKWIDPWLDERWHLRDVMMRERLLLEAENLLCKDIVSVSRKETFKERAKVFALNLKMDLLTAYEVRMLTEGPHQREGTF